MALANEPDLLLADEVTAELDSANAERVMEVIFDAVARARPDRAVRHPQRRAGGAGRAPLRVVDGGVVDGVSAGAPESEVESVSKHFATDAGVVRAVDGVSLEVERRQQPRDHRPERLREVDPARR